MDSFSESAYGFVIAHPGIGHRELANFIESQGSSNPDSVIKYVRDVQKRIVFEGRYEYLPEYKTTGKVIGYYAIPIQKSK